MDSCSLLDLYPIIFKGNEFVMSLSSSSSVRIANMKTTQTTLFTLFILLPLISSLLLVDGYIIGLQPTKKTNKDRSFEDLSEFTIKDNIGKRVMQERHYQQIERNICLSARELDCERELQDQ